MGKYRFQIIIVAFALIIACVIRANDTFNVLSDEYAEQKSVLLKSSKGSCSGEQIESPSGIRYILTAAHCKKLSEGKDSISVITEDGRKLERKIIAEDPNSDLLLLEGVPDLEGLKIADKSEQKQHVKTFTHGNGYPTYKTDGVLISIETVAISIGINGVNGLDCSLPKYRTVETTDDSGNPIQVCILYVSEFATTAKVVPGSSGGMVLNDDNELVGVVSGGNDNFGFIVTTKDIKRFILNY